MKLSFKKHLYLSLKGMIFPSMTSMVARWIPKNERSTSAALTTSGNQLAGIFALLISSFFCGSDLLGGWPLIFYFFGKLLDTFLNTTQSLLNY